MLAGEIAIAAHELFAAPDRFFERKIFKTMEWIVMHERPHRPILRNDFAGEMDDSAQFHPPRFDVDRRVLFVPCERSSREALVNGVRLEARRARPEPDPAP